MRTFELAAFAPQLMIPDPYGLFQAKRWPQHAQGKAAKNSINKEFPTHSAPICIEGIKPMLSPGHTVHMLWERLREGRTYPVGDRFSRFRRVPGGDMAMSRALGDIEAHQWEPQMNCSESGKQEAIQADRETQVKGKLVEVLWMECGPIK